jgi:spermidine synthase
MRVVMKTDGPLLVDKQTLFQKLQIGRNKFWGKVMYLDDVLMCTERDEFVYHEMLCHVPMMAHPNPKRVLIIGGGDGGSARELMKHKGLEKCVMVDIDGMVVEECRKHMPSLNNGAFEDPRLQLIIGDGIDYVKKAPDNSFDVIVVDSTDPFPDTCGAVLFTKEFYENCYRVLSRDGVMTTMSTMPMRKPGDLYLKCMRNL